MYQIGDRIIVEIDEETMAWGFRPCENGLHGVIIKFEEIVFGRTEGCVKRPGVYENNHYFTVRLDDGREVDLGRHHVVSEDPAVADRPWLADPKFLRDLPETRFWEGDLVRCTDKPQGILRVEHIGYESQEYTIKRVGTDLVRHDVREENLALVSRGNLWKHAHGEPLKFDSLAMEANFFYVIGEAEQVRNPRTGNYHWEREEILQGIREGFGHYIVGGDSLFKYNDKDLGERLSEATLNGEL